MLYALYVGLPKSFWVEATTINCFLINCSPSNAIDKKTPQEVWSGTSANYSDLKIFGCPTFAHVDNGKLEPRSIKCVFLGYKSDVKGYKLQCLKTKKVIVNRDMFYETAMLHDSFSRDSYDKKQHKSNTRVEFEIVLGSMPDSTSQSSSGMKSGVVALSPPPPSPQYSIAKNRPRRYIKPPQRYIEVDLVAYALNVVECIDYNAKPSTYSKTVNCDVSRIWMVVMQEEMGSLHKNGTWYLVRLTKGKKVVCCK